MNMGLVYALLLLSSSMKSAKKEASSDQVAKNSQQLVFNGANQRDLFVHNFRNKVLDAVKYRTMVHYKNTKGHPLYSSATGGGLNTHQRRPISTAHVQRFVSSGKKKQSLS